MLTTAKIGAEAARGRWFSRRADGGTGDSSARRLPRARATREGERNSRESGEGLGAVLKRLGTERTLPRRGTWAWSGCGSRLTGAGRAG